MKNARVTKALSLLMAMICLFGCFVGCNKSTTESTTKCEHKNYEWIIIKQPTYKVEGTRRADCLDCGKPFKTESVPIKKCSHPNPTWVVKAEPTEYTYGLKSLICYNCNATIGSEQMPPTVCNHPNTNWVVDAQPTYQQAGSKHLECTSCGKNLKTETIPKLECTHTSTKWVVDTPATIQKEGSKHLECVDCGANLKTETIPKEKCTHSNTKWIIDIAATIQKEGKKSLKCQSCGVTLQTETIAKLTCSHTDSKWITDVQPTFTKEGSKHLQCNTCGVSVKTEAIPKLTCSHLLQKWIIDVYPTAEETGSKHLECSSCGKTLQTEIISKCAHTNTKWNIFSLPTYEFVGLAYNECTDCGAIIESVFLPKLVCEHTDTKWVIDKEPTSFSNGSRHLECIACGENLKTETIYGKELSQSEIKSKLKDSVIKVMCYDYDGKTVISQGSGFFIDDDGTFITNAHAVENCFYIKVKTTLSTFDVKVMYVYNYGTSDYAICKIDGFYTSKPVEFVESASVGDTVYALGFPKDASYLQITKGKITHTNIVDGSKHFYENTARIDHGSSGGVLCDAYGRVLGITTGDGQYTDYLALKYQDFKLDVEKKHTGSKTPFEYFHKIEEVRLDSYNAENYFDVYVNGNFTSDTKISYEVVVALKEKYKNSKFLIDGSGIRVTLHLNTIIEYQEITSYGTYNKSTNINTSFSFNFNDKEDLFEGKEDSETVSFRISANDYYITNAYYEIKFSHVSGTLEFYL